MSSRSLVMLLSLATYGLAQAIPCLGFTEVATDVVQDPSLVDPSLFSTSSNSQITLTGIELFFYGFFGVLFLQIPAMGWLANPLYGLSLFFFSRARHRKAALLALIALLIGAVGTASAFYFNLPNGSAPSELMLRQLLIGFWLWLAAPGVIALAALRLFFQQSD